MSRSTPIPLRNPGGETLAWACMVCRTAYQQQESARRCCICPTCNGVNLFPLKAPASREHAKCSKQREKKLVEREAARYFERKAPADIEVIPHWGPVFCAEYTQHQDGFFSCAALLRSWCEEAGLRVPRRAYVCTARPLDLDVEHLQEQATAELTESAAANIRAADWKGLQRLVYQWAKEQKLEGSWHASDRYMVAVKEKKA